MTYMSDNSVTDEILSGKGFGRNQLRPNWDTIPAFGRRDYAWPQNYLVRIDSVSSTIWTKYLRNTSVEHYR
jgi:hypothetical protein